MLNKLKKFNWTKNMFLVPILLVAGISISHVVSWYDMANPISWAIYLSIAIEVGAMTSLIAATKKIKGGVWFMFGLVTFIQMMGNIFYSYVQIDEAGDLFKNWVELTSPIFEMMGTDSTDIIPDKRWLALLEGGFLPLISLTALHFYIKYDDGTNIDEGRIPKVPIINQEPNIQEPTISVQPNDEPIGKYDLKFGPEYTKFMKEMDEVEEPTPQTTHWNAIEEEHPDDELIEVIDTTELMVEEKPKPQEIVDEFKLLDTTSRDGKKSYQIVDGKRVELK